MAMPKEYFREYYRKNREAILEKNRAHYRANRERKLAKSAEWRAANPERMKELQRRHSTRNREKVNTRSREWYADNKPRAKQQARARKLAGYGLTPEQFMDMLTATPICPICATTFTVPSKACSTQPVIDHCHRSGRVRGLLCRHCNSALGLFKDSPEVLQRAARYLASFSSGST